MDLMNSARVRCLSPAKCKPRVETLLSTEYTEIPEDTSVEKYESITVNHKVVIYCSADRAYDIIN